MSILKVRDDDILVHSRQYKAREFDRFKDKHEVICKSDKLLHVPAILVSEIQDFPQCVNYVKSETIAGRMHPELHGYKHVDYAALAEFEVIEHLEQSLEWFTQTFNFLPTKWYTPFGAGVNAQGIHLVEIAKRFNLTLVGVYGAHNEYPEVQVSKELTTIMREIREGKSFNQICLENEDTMYHWWARGSRLERLVEVSIYGSWSDAAIFNKELFQ